MGLGLLPPRDRQTRRRRHVHFSMNFTVRPVSAQVLEPAPPPFVVRRRERPTCRTAPVVCLIGGPFFTPASYFRLGEMPCLPSPCVMLLCLDTPQAGQRCDALCFRVEGWLHPDESGDQAILVEAWVGGHCVGSTRHLFVRPDVNLQQGWSEGTRSGFSLVAHAAAGPSQRN